MRAGPVDTLLRRQQCHDMRAAGATQRQIQAAVDAGRAAVRDWLSRPRPTDEEIDSVRHSHANPQTDSTGQVGFKSRFDPTLFARLRAEAELQGAPTNKVIGCAVALYLDCLERARTGGTEPINIMGYR